ncbi:MAG: hypothetical protein R3E93_15525 [Thiothrix sp.]
MEQSKAFPLIRSLLIGTGIVLLVLAVAFVSGVESALALWPWQSGNLSYTFVASIFAAIGTPVLWMGLTGDLAAMRAGALDFAMTYLGLTLVLLLPQAATVVDITPFLIFTSVSLLFNLLLYGWARQFAFKDQRPVPGLLRWSFLVFMVVLVGVGISLITLQPHVFPWPLKQQTSIVFGWIFLGAAVYFLHGFIYPVWSNVCGQLLGFLAYDLVLLIPFIRHFDAVKPEHYLSLTTYTAVISYSALLSLYYLLLNPGPRLFHGDTRPR